MLLYMLRMYDMEHWFSIKQSEELQRSTDSDKSSMIFCFSLISSRRRPTCLLCASRCSSICCSRALWDISNKKEKERDKLSIDWQRAERVLRGGNLGRTKWLNSKGKKLHTSVHMCTWRATWALNTLIHTQLCQYPATENDMSLGQWNLSVLPGNTNNDNKKNIIKATTSK